MADFDTFLGGFVASVARCRVGCSLAPHRFVPPVLPVERAVRRSDNERVGHMLRVHRFSLDHF